jgi:hypothetical protein
MIGKLIQGTDFHGCLSYVLGKPGADRLGGSAIGSTVAELTAEFDRLRLKRPTLSHAVYHLSLSLAPGESLEAPDWNDLTHKYLERMDITRTNYVFVRHTDTDRDHIHIVASRIRFDGSVVDDSWDYSRSQAILRDLESEYNLTPVVSSQSVDRHAPTRRQIEKTKQTGQETVKARLQQLIDEEIPLATTLDDLRDRLELHGVTTRFTYSKNGSPKGISFGSDGVALAGHHLGRSYSLPQLLQRLPSPQTIAQSALIDVTVAQQDKAEASNSLDAGILQKKVYHRLYDQLAEQLRQSSLNLIDPVELDLEIARHIVQNGGREDIKALIYSPEVQARRQIDQAQADLYLQFILQAAVNEQEPLKIPSLDQENII